MVKKNFLKSSLVIAIVVAMMLPIMPKISLAATSNEPIITYSAHTQTFGWPEQSPNSQNKVVKLDDYLNSVPKTTSPAEKPGVGTFAGTTNLSKRVEALRMNLEGVEGVTLKYSVHQQTYSWSNWTTNGAVAGKTGDGKRAEAVKISVTGLERYGYSLYYRAQVQNLGWLEWVEATSDESLPTEKSVNAGYAGTVQHSYRLEAVQLTLVKTETENNAFKFTVNDNNIVNDTNATKSTITIETADKMNVDETTKFDLYYVDDSGKDVRIVSNLQIDEFSNKKINTGKSLSSLVSNSLVAKDSERKITLKLKRTSPAPEEFVATTTVTVNRIHPEAVRISAERNGTQGAKLKFEAKDGSDIVKVHYVIDTNNAYSGAGSSSSESFANPTTNTTIKTMEVSNNAFNATLPWTALGNTTAYYVHFVVENAAGNLSDAASTHVYTAVVPKDDATQESKVTEVSVDDNLTVHFKEPANLPNSGYKIIIYNEEGNVVAEVNKAKGTSSSAATQSILTDITEAGKYTLTIVSLGNSTDGSTKPSDETEPVSFEVTQLPAVTGLRFDEDDSGTTILKWDEYTGKDNSAFQNYTINIYKYNPATKDYENSKSSYKNNISKDTTSIKLSEVHDSATFTPTDNTRYKAEIIANGTGKVISSQATATPKDYCKITIAMGSAAVSDTEIDLTMTTPAQITSINALGDVVTYDVEVWSKTTTTYGDEAHWVRTNVIENVTFVDGKIVKVSGLTPNTTDGYKFVLVAHVDGDKAEGRTTPLNNMSSLSATKTKSTLPSLNGMVVISTASTAADTANGKVYTDGSANLYINGTKVDFTHYSDYYDPNNLLASSASDAQGVKLVNSLKPGDKIVSLDNEKVVIEATESATSGTARDIDVGNKRVLEIRGNKWLQEVKADRTKVKEVILSGEVTIDGPLFKVDADPTAEVKLANGVKLENGTDKATVTVLANANVTINEIDISSNGDLKCEETFNSTKHELKIGPAGNQTINISNHSGKDLEVTFMNGAQAGDTQVGAVVIESNAGVSVQAGASKNNGNMAADITVKATNGNIDIQDSGLKGGKTIIVSTTEENNTARTITAYTTNESPINLSDVEIQDYTVEDLKALRAGSIGSILGGTKGISKTSIDSLTDAQLEQLSNYFNAFGSALKGIGATVTTGTASEKKVTITLPKGSEVVISNATIEGLQ